jgi:hypothetical protein
MPIAMGYSIWRLRYPLKTTVSVQVALVQLPQLRIAGTGRADRLSSSLFINCQALLLFRA